MPVTLQAVPHVAHVHHHRQPASTMYTISSADTIRHTIRHTMHALHTHH